MIQKSKKIILAGLGSTVAAAYIFGSFAQAEDVTKNKPSPSTAKDKLEAYVKFTQIISVIESQYVDEINTTELVDKALKGLVANLDSHSAFMDKKEYKDLSVQTKGEFGGLGISIGMKEGALTVIAPIDGTPAFHAGIKSGDIILKINDTATIGMNIDESVKMMRGKPKTKVSLTIIRKGESKPLEFTITRDIINIQSVYAKTIDNNILYIHVTSFDQKVVEGVKKALKEHKDAKGIILDLRNNPGGLLDQAVDLVDLFVDKGVIVSQKGKVESENQDYMAHKQGSDTTTPIVVLVNGGSASASEIVLPMGTEEALKLTVARYYLPSGRTIQAIGVTPDINVPLGKLEIIDDNLSIKESDLKKHLENELSKIDDNASTKSVSKNTAENNATKEDDSIITQSQLYKDVQLKSAVDILKALIITQKGKK
ncbi:MAG: peptidase S41 [Sulfurovum sp. 28-43-6]|nr:MAG: peptidase S41 [Sulfurovum sp. 28-43-6]